MPEHVSNETKQMQEEIKASRARGGEASAEPTGIFVACASAYEIGNFKPERRTDNAFILEWEGSVKFREHLLLTDDQEVIEFVEKSKGFIQGDITRHDHMDSALQRRYALIKAKNAERHLSVEDVTIKPSITEFRE
jgi:hypothetical protein